LTNAAGTTAVAGKLDVYSHDEEGLQGVAVDPGFASNRFVYLYYAPKLSTPAGDAPADGTAADFAPFDGVNRLSRLVLKTDGTLDLGSEKKILDVPASRGICCHVGGDIDFDAAGNLYLPTTTPRTTSTCSRPVRRSARTTARPAPRTTRRTTPASPRLPASRAAWLPYGGAGPWRPEIGGGGPQGGPVYNFNPALVSDVKFPASYNGKVFIGEFTSRWIKAVTLTGTGTAGAIDAFPWTGTAIMDMEFGPDGALYVLDYGTGWFGGDANSALYRIEHVTDGLAPTAQAKADVTSGKAPLAVSFSSAGSADPDGGALSYAWTFGDGATSTAANPSHRYATNGQYTATLKVTDTTGKSATASVQITVGTPRPR
jgi:hypothetical protein